MNLHWKQSCSDFMIGSIPQIYSLFSEFRESYRMRDYQQKIILSGTLCHFFFSFYIGDIRSWNIFFIYQQLKLSLLNLFRKISWWFVGGCLVFGRTKTRWCSKGNLTNSTCVFCFCPVLIHYNIFFSQFLQNRCGFEEKGEIWVEDILNLGVS